MSLRIASSPYTHNRQQTHQLMRWVVLACLPGLIAQSYFFGYGNLIQVILCIGIALLAETLVLYLRHQPIIPRLQDNSALLTGLLLGVSLPSLAPWWIGVIATLFAIVIAKHLYGGLGHNLFNPAMVGYVVVLISFPVQMTSWPSAETLQTATLNFYDTLLMVFTGHTTDGRSLSLLLLGADGISQATPLDNIKTALHARETSVNPLASMIDMSSQESWRWINLGFLLGGLFLLGRKIIHWQIPVGVLGGLLTFSLIGWYLAPESCATPTLHLLSGATMLGAFFIATDPVTAATTPRGRLIFGAVIGILIWVIRTYGGYPDGVAFAVLLANITVPLLDYYTQPRVYGHH